MRKAAILFALALALLSILTARAGEPEIHPRAPATPLPHAPISDYVKFRGRTTAYWDLPDSDHIWVVNIEQLLVGSFYPCNLGYAHVIVYSPPPSPLYPPCDDGYVDPALAIGDFVEVWGFRPWPDDSGDAGCAVNVCAHSSYYIRKWSASPTPTRTQTPTRTRTATPSRTSTRPIHRMRLPMVFRDYHKVP